MPRAGLNAPVLVEKSIAIIDSEGIEHITFSRLATEFGVAPPSLYKHLQGISDLFNQVAALVTRQLAEQISFAARGRSGKDALESLSIAYRQFALSHPGCYPLTQRNREYQPWKEAADEVVTAAVAALHGYGITKDNVDQIRLARSALHGFVSLELDGGFGLQNPVDDSFSLLIDQLDLSFRTPSCRRKSNTAAIMKD